MVVEAGFVGYGFTGIFGGARELEGLWTVEGGREAHFADFFGVDLA